MDNANNQSIQIGEVKNSATNPKPMNLQADYLQLLKYQQDCQLQKIEIDQLLKLFKRFDTNKNGKLQFNDMLLLIQEYGLEYDQQCKEKMFKEMEDRNTSKLDFQTLLYIVRVCKDYKQAQNNIQEEICQSEYLDAYVALGGDPDSSGYIIKSKLVSILSEEFELAFDLEDLLEQLEVVNDQIDFQQFKKLFKSDKQRTIQRNSSLLSLISQKTIQTQRSTSSISTVKIRMKDFEKFLQKLENEENDGYLSSPSPQKKK